MKLSACGSSIGSLPARVRRGAYGVSYGLVVLVLLGVADAKAARGRELGGVVLFTPEEAKQLRLTKRDWPHTRRARGLLIPAGPRIVVRDPQLKNSSTGPTIETVTPANLVIVFEENSAPIDMRSLQITARKGLFSKSLTEILTPYVHGTSLGVRDATIPEGNFLIEIEIADRSGARTVETYRLHVTGR